MSRLSRIVDLITFRDLPANRAPETRGVGGVVVPTHQLGRAQWPQRDPGTYVRDGYGKVVVAYRCVNVLANAVATAPVRVYDEAAGGQRDELDDHPMRRLMRQPNPFMGEARFLRLLTKIAASAGFVVVEKQRGRDIVGMPGRVVGLWPLRSDWIKPIPRENAPPDWEYRVPGRLPQVLKAEDAIPFVFEDDPSLGSIGVPPLSVALREVGIKSSMVEFTKIFFDRGSMVPYALIPADDVELDKTEADELREMWKQRYGGVGSAAEVAILTSVKDVRRIGLDFNEMAYPDLTKLTELAICTAFGVEPILVGIKAGLDASTYSNYGQARRAFYEDTIEPLWAALDDALTTGLLPEFETRPTVTLEFDTSNVRALQDDETPKWERVTAARWFITVNDARREVNLPELPDGDVFLRSIADVEVPARVNGNGRARVIDGEWRVVDGKMVQRGGHADPGSSSASSLPDTHALGATVALGLGPVRATGQPSRGLHHTNGSTSLYRLPAETRASVAASAKQTIARLGEAAEPVLARFFREQGARIIPLALRSAETTPETRDIADIDWFDEQRRLMEVVRGVHVAAGEAAFSAAGELTGVSGFSFDLANPFVHHVLDQIGQRDDVLKLSETTSRDVAKIVADALNEGVTLDELGGRLRELFTTNYATRRAATLGRTESQVAYNLASVEGYRQSGVVGMVELSDNPRHTEDYGAGDGLTCATRHGLIVELDAVSRHVAAEHPNGSLACLPVLSTPLGEV